MRYTFIFVLLLNLLNITVFGQNVKIPGSTRSKKAILENTERLSNEMELKDLSLGNPIYMRLFKNEKQLEIWMKNHNTFKLFNTYDVCYFSGGLGTKTKQGDCKSPEGFYFVKPSFLNPHSNYHLSFNTGYPNHYERLKKYTGSAIMVHGDCVSIGCYAMGNKNIEEIWTIIDAAFREGQNFIRLHIFPFRMSNENINIFDKEEYSTWKTFWANLKEGYDFFEEHGIPPNVNAVKVNYEVKYIFE